MTSQQVNKSTSQQAEVGDTREFAGRFRGDLPERSFAFALELVDLLDQFPENTKGWVVGKQVLRSGTSIGANIAEANQALSDAEFVHRCSIARKEAAETRYWLRICQAKKLAPFGATESLLLQVDEFVRILGTIVRRSQMKQ